MGLLGYMLVALLVIVGLAVAYDLRNRRKNRGLPDELRESGRESARRDAQADRSPEARTRPEDRGHDSYGGGVGI
jgi:hypothetical protein